MFFQLSFGILYTEKVYLNELLAETYTRNALNKNTIDSLCFEFRYVKLKAINIAYVSYAGKNYERYNFCSELFPENFNSDGTSGAQIANDFIAEKIYPFLYMKETKKKLSTLFRRRMGL